MDNLKRQVNKQEFFDICHSVLGGFINTMSKIRWQKKGIFFSEALAFVAMCKKYNINTIVESGVRNGDSTEMWLKYFGDDVRVYSVDLMQYENDVNAAINRLSGYKNLEFRKGDGEVVVPTIVESLPKDARVGMLLDGPKSFGAMRIIEKCFKNSDLVKFASIHDMGMGALQNNGNPEYHESIKVLNTWDNYTFITDDKEFRERFVFVDEALGEGLGGEWNKSWDIYKQKYPVGCGLAFVENV
tara:strand:- start:1368 stop:2096 length:729 start_codon:yes stop_codon:yes gene_type:complete